MVLIGIGVVIYRKTSEVRDPTRPRKPDLEPLGGKENLRRMAEWKRDVAKWKAAKRARARARS